MRFAFCPDDAPPRLIRFVEPGVLPGRELLSIYDASKNLVIINRELYAQLPKQEQRETLRTQRPSISIGPVGLNQAA